MRKPFMTTAIAVMISVFTAPIAQAQGFLFGFGAGLLLGSGDEYGGGSASIMYALPRVNERVRDALGVRTIAWYGCFKPSKHSTYQGTRTLEQLFSEALRDHAEGLEDSDKLEGRERESNASRYTVLQVARIFEASDSYCASFWFTYIEASKVLSLESLESQEQR